MRIAVLGTGIVGRSMADGAAKLGHQVLIGTRDPEETLKRTGDDAMGNPPLSTWLGEHPEVRLSAFAEAAEQGELVVNATSGASSLAVLELAGAQNLDGKVLIDIANPLDFSAGFPPTLFVKDTDSLGEQIQRAFPKVRVVKVLNTLTSQLMTNPQELADGDHSIFMSGDDAEAKDTVIGLLRSFGWRDIIDLGDISTARGSEMLAAIWLRLMNALGTPMFNFKIVR